MLNRRIPQSIALLGALSFVGPAILFGAESTPAASSTTQPSNGVSGTWKWQVEGPGGQIDVVLKLKQDGDKLTGTISGFNGEESQIEDGKVHDGQLSFKVVRDFNGRSFTTNYTGTLNADGFKGKSETIFAQDFDAKRSAD